MLFQAALRMLAVVACQMVRFPLETVLGRRTAVMPPTAREQAMTAPTQGTEARTQMQLLPLAHASLRALSAATCMAACSLLKSRPHQPCDVMLVMMSQHPEQSRTAWAMGA